MRKIYLLKSAVSIIIMSALFVNSCSYCKYVPKESYLTIDPEQEILLEIQMVDGSEYETKNFSFVNDSLFIYKNSKRLKNEAKIFSIDSINTIKCCEFSTERARKRGLIFTSVTLFFLTLVLIAPLKMGTIGG